MHRIDVPSATADHKFTEGSPTGGVPATTVSGDWLNDVQENIMAVVEAGGVTPIKGRASDLLVAIRGLGLATFGLSLNARMNVPTASASATWTADLIVLGSAGGGKTYNVSNFGPLAINLGAVGLGGMDIGAAPVSGYVAIYAIYNPTTGTMGLLAVDTTTVVAPEFYGGANAPAGFTASALVAVIQTTAARLIYACTIIGRKVFFAFQSAVSSVGTVPAITAVNLAPIVPKNAKAVSGFAAVGSTAATNAAIGIFATLQGVAGKQIAGSPPTGSAIYSGAFSDMPLPTPQQMFWQVTIATGTLNSAQVNISGFEF